MCALKDNFGYYLENGPRKALVESGVTKVVLKMMGDSVDACLEGPRGDLGEATLVREM